MAKTIRTPSLILAAALLMAFAFACKSGGGDRDDTNREITDDELAQMVLALADYGGAYDSFEEDTDNGLETLDQRAEDDFDPEGERADLEEFGWQSGYTRDYMSAEATASETGVFLVGSGITLFQDVEGASGYFEDTKQEIADFNGTTSEGLTINDVQPFGLDAGDEAAGYVMAGTFEDADGSTTDVSMTMAGFRRGRLVGSVGLAAFEDRSSQEGVGGWARLMDRRIGEVLAGAAVSDDPSDGDGDAIDFVSTDPKAVLSESAASFGQDVTSVQGEMIFSADVAGLSFELTATLAFQAPDSMYMTMDLDALGSYEALLLGEAMYINIPPQGWVVFSFEDLLGEDAVAELGLDGQSFQEAFSDHSIVDLEQMFAEVGGEVQDLGEETIEGQTYRHYQGTVDFSSLAAAFSDALGATEGLNLDQVSGPLTIDAWVDTATLLPYKITMGGEVAYGAEAMVFDASIVFSGYNEPVTIPPAPADAMPFTDLLSGLFQE
jgi:hypothetical protein